MTLKFLLDEDTQVALSQALRQRGFETLHVAELGRKGYSDAEQLEFAVSQDYCFFTYNKRDFVILHTEYITLQKPLCGIIVSPHLSISEVMRRLGVLVKILSAEEMRNELRFL
jgi:predicted nuclease of predicted toxin-antitoxin system